MESIKFDSNQVDHLFFHTIFNLNNMKKCIFLLVLLFQGILVFAQTDKEDLAMVQASFGKDKKQIVQQYMQFSPADSVKFWPVYDQFEKERQALGVERYGIIENYAKQYATLNDDQATKLAQSTFANDGKYNDLYKNYFPKFAKAVGGLTSAKFFQLESYIQNTIRLGIQEEIPFIGELKTTKKM